MTRKRKIQQQLKQLRAECIEQETDPVLRKIAYAMEQAVRYATEDGIRGWEPLHEQARGSARLLWEEVVRK